MLFSTSGVKFHVGLVSMRFYELGLCCFSDTLLLKNQFCGLSFVGVKFHVGLVCMR